MTTTNNCQGTVHTTRCEHTAAPALKKRDCEKVRTDVRDAEKSMGWLQWIATKDDSWRNPWVVFAKFNECKRLPEQLDAGAYTQLRDRLQAYDRGELKMSGEDAIELRRTVNLVQMRYDNVPNPYHTMPSNYISPAEQEVYDRFGNNMTMALVPATIPGIAGTRAMGGTEAQARAGGELSAMAFGFMGARFMQKHGLLKNNPQPVQSTRSGSPTISTPVKPVQPTSNSSGFVVNKLPPHVQYDGKGPLYRGDNRDPNKIFNEGFDSRGKNTNVGSHQAGGKDTSYVPTSVSESEAIKFAKDGQPAGGKSYVYDIDNRGLHSVDVNATTKNPWFENEREIAIFNRVPPQNIYGAREVLPNGQLGPLLPNPNYRPPVKVGP
jgi:hypothetical protein